MTSPLTATVEQYPRRERKTIMPSTVLKAATAFTLIALLGVGTTACAGESAPPADSSSTTQPSEPEPVEEKPQPVDLAGEWMQKNPNDPENFQSATITDGVIEIYWNAPDIKALYWAGTVEAPQDGTQSFTWDSANDTAKTSTSIMASSDTTKTFTYADGELSYDVTAMGTTVTVQLVRQ
jgi:hypothetical protein